MTAGSLHRSRHCVQVESSCIENTKLERKEEKKLKERIVKEKTTKQPLRQASARPVGEPRAKLVM